MSDKKVSIEEQAKCLQTLIDQVEKQMAAVVGMNLYKQAEGFFKELL